MNKQTNLSEHMTLAELCKTRTGIENVPNEAQVENLKRVCRWLERLRKRWNDKYGDGDDPIIINSGFRSAAVKFHAVGKENEITKFGSLIFLAYFCITK